MVSPLLARILWRIAIVESYVHMLTDNERDAELVRYVIALGYDWGKRDQWARAYEERAA